MGENHAVKFMKKETQNYTKPPPSKPPGAKEALLDAAQELFIDKGYATVSTRDIADKADVNLGSIQYYFGSKANLFIATIQRMMQMSPCAEACSQMTLTVNTSAKNQLVAITQLCGFIHSFMDHLLRPQGPQACRVMFREIFTDTSNDPKMFEALVSSVTEDFTRPMENTLVSLLRHMRPQASLEELEHNAQSILGQCSFYATHRPFLERLRGGNFSQSPLFERIVEHICRFSLRALGCSESSITKVIDKTLISKGQPVGSKKKKAKTLNTHTRK